MATRTVVKVDKKPNSKVPWKVVFDCGHGRYLLKEVKVGDKIQCVQKKCKWVFE